MQYRVLIQNPQPEVFTAAVLDGPDCAAQGPTKEAALAAVRAALEAQLAHGEVVTIEVNGCPLTEACANNPWLTEFGRFRDDPTYDDFLAEIAAYRRELDAAEEAREKEAEELVNS
jgi:predicted RNase H-like HicB family nuclease